MDPIERVPIVRFSDGAPASAEDAVVVEEPLEIRIDGDTFAVTMRTPGHDRELVLGLLLAEGIIRSAADVSSLAYCGKPEEPRNTMAVTLGPLAEPPIDRATGELVRRGTLVSSACGVCGRRSIDDLLARIPRRELPDVAPEALVQAMTALAGRQPIFAETGGAHAAALVVDGAPVASFEDIGRHNAVDKVVGAQLLAGQLGARGRILVVSGRASFEIVQKALVAGFDAVASVSAASSLAVSLAREGGLALAGFVRGDSLVSYVSRSH